jgi:hypothetical protein
LEKLPPDTEPAENGLVAIEAWNEPNLDVFWGVPEGQPFAREPLRFARLVNLASAKVAQVAPEINVLPGALSPLGKNVNTFMLEAADPQKADRIVPERIAALSFHLYAFDPLGGKLRNDRRLRKQVHDYYDNQVSLLRDAFKDKNRWITEIGYPSVATGQLESGSIRSQRRRLLRAHFEYARLPRIQSFVVHNLVGSELGLLNDDLSPKVLAGEPPTRSGYCRLAERVDRPSDPVDPSRC